MFTLLIVGAGINGVVAAIELRKRGHHVTLIDPGPLPHPLAASTDISKAVRSCYGNDELYTALAERAIVRWRDWNAEFGTTLYHETGVMFLSRAEMQPGSFEYESFRLLSARKHKVERIRSDRLRQRFPAWNADKFPDGFYDPEGGYAESGRVVAALLERATAQGVVVREKSEFAQLGEGENGVEGAVLSDGTRLKADKMIIAAGAWTPTLLPFTGRFLRASGHPVFHLKPNDPRPFAPAKFPMFGADIAATGYYGFPINGEGVVKVARCRPIPSTAPLRPMMNPDYANSWPGLFPLWLMHRFHIVGFAFIVILTMEIFG
jgi:sarcosine oxidase / L-pipecolate oxidase